MGNELDVVANELAGARRELREAQEAAVIYLRGLALADRDPVAADLVACVDAAMDRLTAANIVGAGLVQEAGRG